MFYKIIRHVGYKVVGPWRLYRKGREVVGFWRCIERYTVEDKLPKVILLVGRSGEYDIYIRIR